MEDTFAKLDFGDQARIAFFHDVLKRQQKELLQWLSPDPGNYSPEMVRSDIAATEARLQELLANLEAVVSGNALARRSRNSARKL